MTQKVIGFHYKLSIGEETIESSFEGGTPLLFLEASQQIIPGLEKELIGMNVGDKKSVNVPSAEAYGDVNAEMVVTVNKSQFPENANLQLGDQFQINETPESPIFRVVKIEGDQITIDGNHPMAGKDLTFDVEITEVRDATQEEIAHGHAHGAGGHNH